MANRALFHLGYPKCASTFLQVKIFSKVQTASYIGAQVHRNITGTVKNEGFDFMSKQKLAETKRFVNFLSGVENGSCEQENSVINYFMNERAQSDLIISDENFLDFRYNNSRFEKRIENLKRVFVEGDSIIIFTKPLIEILISMYRDHPITYFEEEKICTFEEFISSPDVLRQPLLLSQKSVINQLQINFGCEQVVVFGVEDIANGRLENYLRTTFNTNILIDRQLERVNAGASALMFEYRILKQKLKFLRHIIPRSAIKSLDAFLLNNLRKMTHGDKKSIRFDSSKVENILASQCDLNYDDIFTSIVQKQYTE